jgi:putative acetyltransferase
MQIREERAGDSEAIRRVHERAFARDNEALLVDRLRDASAFLLSLVAVDGSDVVGHILFTRVEIASAGATISAVGLAPMAVLPSNQGHGIGSDLVREGLTRLREAGHEIVVVLGYPAYYSRFGFRRASQFDVRWEHRAPDEAFLLLELAPNALGARGGVARFRREFDAV